MRHIQFVLVFIIFLEVFFFFTTYRFFQPLLATCWQQFTRHARQVGRLHSEKIRRKERWEIFLIYEMLSSYVRGTYLLKRAHMFLARLCSSFICMNKYSCARKFPKSHFLPDASFLRDLVGRIKKGFDQGWERWHNSISGSIRFSFFFFFVSSVSGYCRNFYPTPDAVCRCFFD